MLTRSERKRILKTTISKSTAPLAAIENAARLIENSSETPLLAGCSSPTLLAGCGVKENSQPILAGCEVREIGEPLLAGCGDTASLARSEAKQK